MFILSALEKRGPFLGTKVVTNRELCNTLSRKNEGAYKANVFFSNSAVFYLMHK